MCPFRVLHSCAYQVLPNGRDQECRIIPLRNKWKFCFVLPGFGSYYHPFIWVFCNIGSGDGSLQIGCCVSMSMKQSILPMIQRLGWLIYPTPLKAFGRHLLLVLRANHTLFWSWGGTVPAGCLGAIWLYMYFLELWFAFSCQHTWACICWKSLRKRMAIRWSQAAWPSLAMTAVPAVLLWPTYIHTGMDVFLDFCSS